MKKVVLLLSISFLYVGCGLRDHGLIDAPPPTVKPFHVIEEPRASYMPGSLYTDQNMATGLISDTKAFRLNDIILINIAERFNAVTNASTETTRSNSASLKIPNLLGLEKTHTQFFGAGTTDGTMVGASGNSEHEGDGTTQRSETFTGSVAGRVVQVLPNGYLVVQGQKSLQVNGELVRFYLSGIVNPLLVTQDNSITSSEIADLNVYYSGRGIITGQQRPGFLSRVLHAVWPF